MLKFKDYLTELFDKPVPYTLSSLDKNGASYSFTINDAEYTVGILDEFEDENAYQIYFYNKTDYGNNYKFNDKLKGNANAVMSTVVAICIDFFTHKVNIATHVNNIHYFASDKSRIKLYNAIFKKLLSHFHVPFTYELNKGFNSDDYIGVYYINA